MLFKLFLSKRLLALRAAPHAYNSTRNAKAIRSRNEALMTCWLNPQNELDKYVFPQLCSLVIVTT